MTDPRVMAAADACVARMRGQPGAGIDRGQMTKPEREAWLDVARQTYRQLVGELTRPAHWDLVMESAGISEAPPDHSFYPDGPTITFSPPTQGQLLKKVQTEAPDAEK
jgi:hypothetical protein